MPDKMTPQIERAARAIMLADPLNNPTNPPKFPDDFSATEAGQYRNEAIAVLSTTLEPSEGEIEQGAKAICVADDEPWDELGETAKDYAPFGYSREWYRQLARACLIAAARVRVG